MKLSKQISLGYDSTGKRVRKRVYADNEADLRQAEKGLLMNARNELLPETRFGVYAEHWLKTYKTTKEANTREYYETAIRKFDAIRNLSLSRIRRSQLQAIISAEWQHPRTAKKLAGTLEQIFRSAVADGLIYTNPAADLDVPDDKPDEKRVLTDAEKAAIASVELEPKQRLFLDVMRQLGLRPEEARALTRSSFNLRERTVTISQASTFAKNAPELKGTKNGKVRTLPCPDGLLRALQSYPEKFLLFPDSNGQLMSKSVFRRFSGKIFSAINRKLGGTDSIDALNGMTWYTLRHTKATELYDLIQKGLISAKLAAYYMGHSEVVFLSVYSHLVEDRKQLEALRNMENATLKKAAQL